MFSFSFLSNRSLISCLFQLNAIFFKSVISLKLKFMYQHIRSFFVSKGQNKIGKSKRDCFKQALMVIHNFNLTMYLVVVGRCVTFTV
jgi:hypothetical protein